MTSAPQPSTAAFTLRNWAVLACVALMWGSSFLLIKIGLEDFPPATVAWLHRVRRARPGRTPRRAGAPASSSG
ncbi:MAG TPA: hypothetical protein VK095_02580 [Beutenbergiaceae bacterium]|nr:hypothetical protein [Beutenbergiaceae bacterium]